MYCVDASKSEKMKYETLPHITGGVTTGSVFTTGVAFAALNLLSLALIDFLLVLAVNEIDFRNSTFLYQESAQKFDGIHWAVLSI